MIRARNSASLIPADRERLRKFRLELEREMSMPIGFPELTRALAAPFCWETLQRALEGKAIRFCSYRFILEFLDRHVPASHSPLDFKSRAAGEQRVR